MLVTQVKDLVNLTTQEVLGEESVLVEDLTNVVDIGQEVIDTENIENFTRKLIDHIGKVIFVNRKYNGSAPSVLMDSWEFGSILEKIQADMPEARTTQDWELEDGQVYEQNTFYKPSVSAKFFNKRVTFEVDLSITEMQVKSAFSSAEQLQGFVSMLYDSVERSMTVKVDTLIMSTINNFTAEVLANEYPTGDYTDRSGVQAVNLLKMYNDKFTQTLTVTESITDKEFIRFASLTISLYMNRMTKMSKLFNIGEKARFTPLDNLHIIMLADFASSADVYLQSDTFNEKYTALPNTDVVPFWQGSGEDYAFTSTSKINVKSASGKTVELSGVLCTMFDKNALGVANLDKRVRTHYNAKAEFFNNFFKFDAGYFNDHDENFVVFFVA